MSFIENAPALELDKILYRNNVMQPHVRRERRIVWNLMKHLYADGAWAPTRVFDGDENTEVDSPLAAMELIFNLDEARVGFTQNGKRTHYVLLVLGNDMDIISDWNFSEGDPDGFSAVMDKFDPEVYA